MRERLKKLMDEKGFNAHELSEQIGVQASSVSHILTGRNKPSLDFLEKMLKAFPDIDIKYLISGVRQEHSQNFDKNIMPNDELGKTNINKSLEDEKTDTVTNVTSNDELVEIVMFYKNGSFERFRQKMN